MAVPVLIALLIAYWIGFSIFCFVRYIVKARHQTSSCLTIIWLDKNHDQATLDLLTSMSRKDFRTFTSVNSCVHFITSWTETNRPLCLITSGSLGVSIIPLVHNVQQLVSIIVFCFEKPKYDYMTKRYVKIRAVCNTYHELIIRTQVLLQMIDKNQFTPVIFDIEKFKELRQLYSLSQPSHLSMTIFDEQKQQSMRDISKSDSFFLWLKLLTNVLQRVHHTREAMTEMLDKCREYYQGIAEELRKIDEFEQTYTKERAIYWYTTPTFVSKLVNKALRTEDFRALYICRAYIADLSEQLHAEYEEYKQLLIEFEQPLAQWTVYHGRTMSQDEIDLLRRKIGQLISLNGFLSTSRKKSVADCYAHEVLFIIETTFELSHGCFAHVASISEFPQEDEVLFDLASVFKLINVQYDPNDGRWHVNLKTTDDGTQVVQAYINSVQIEANEIKTDFIFARLLIQMGEYTLATDYLTKLMTIAKGWQTNDRDLALCYYYRGLSFYREGNYAQSMIEYEQALMIQRQIFPDGHSDLGETLGGIGLLYDNMGKYELALQHHLEGLIVSEKTLPTDHVHIAESLHNIGLCYDRMGKFDLAIKYDIQALEMKQRLFPYDHPDIATSLNNIGLAYYNHHDFIKALQYHEKSLAMKNRCLPPDHPELAVSYCNLGLAHLALSHFDEAILYSMLDLTTSEATLPLDHAELGISHHNLAQVYRSKEKDSQLALKHYEKAIDIYMKTLSREHPYIAFSLMYMAEVQATQGRLYDALPVIQEAVNILEMKLSEDHLRRAESLYILAEIEKKLGHHDQALVHASGARTIQTKTLDIDHKDVQKQGGNS